MTVMNEDEEESSAHEKEVMFFWVFIFCYVATRLCAT